MTDVPNLSTVAAPTQGVDVDASRLASRANLEAAGKQFEAVFTSMMVKSMRAPHLAEDIFGSKAGDTFREMQDQQFAKTMAEHAPLGIGKAMTEFLSKSQANLQAASAESTTK
ncbi:rod-binding protein [Sphingomonas immobilis]|uniref:Rod-binding protein n=1 Tax=Sphingomonas immobilis TaxID=3063997 RepID=A0ABT8ZV96_9SPHN|nr:rod-binding protein [Sphingomonas sp. CA1-15]MDO7841510.1 rod-binding protein [Sphingomonas sp. CA1-15]